MTKLQKNATFFTVAIILTFALMYWQFFMVGWGVNASLIVATAFAVMTLLVGLVSYGIQAQRQKTAYEQKHKASESQAAEQVRTVEIDMPFEAAFDLALEALQALDEQAIPKTFTGIPSKQKVKIHSQDPEIGRIKAGLQAKTFGIRDFTDFSSIEIQVQRLDAQTSRVRIESQSTNPLEAFDLARHLHYVNQIALTLRQASQANSAENRLEDAAQDTVDHDTTESQENKTTRRA